MSFEGNAQMAAQGHAAMQLPSVLQKGHAH